MTQKETLVRIAAIVSALDETNGSPESMLYIFCDMNMGAWTWLREILIKADLIKIAGHFVTLTENGKETARRLNAALTRKEV